MALILQGDQLAAGAWAVFDVYCLAWPQVFLPFPFVQVMSFALCHPAAFFLL